MEDILEKLAILSFVLLVIVGLFYENYNYENVPKEYYDCKPYDSTLDPVLPLLTQYELDNFEKNYNNFLTKYNCKIKMYTRKQFSIIRKSTK